MGQQEQLGPHGELIHTPELTNYEKVRGTLRVNHCRDCEAANG